MTELTKRSLFNQQALALMPLCIALNIALGGVVHFLKLPIYLDATGTILATLLLGLPAGVIVGVASFLLASLVISPVYVFFVGTQAAIAIYIYLVARYLHGLLSTPRAIATGIGLGVLAGVVSAPIIVLVFGGVSGSGRDLVTALIASSGQQILNAVMLSGAASEPIDKTLQVLIAFSLLRGSPKGLLERFRNPWLVGNGFLKAPG
ncbi:hypothetical protein [uncultured Thiohalocapsa sp.]|uniref:hypothetical protein n=1 Tax=uncultured Thiohalocapsa sp. TaxID=768990 RepID=UPI0025E721E4|nr:hypothetical protein [uncultured Thiohalocapsa sp.]